MMRNGVLPAPPAEMLPMLTTGACSRSRTKRAAIVEAVANLNPGAIERAQRIQACLSATTAAVPELDSRWQKLEQRCDRSLRSASLLPHHFERALA